MTKPLKRTNALELAPHPFAELRGAPRYALMLRTAKLVCDSGEYLCIIRDVSASGVRLRLLHDLPQYNRMALVLGNNDFYFIELVWNKDGHAGFRFAGEIDVDIFIDEPSQWPRRPLRVNIKRAGLIHALGVTSSAGLVDLSQLGARIETDRHLALGQQIRLEVEGLPERFAKVCWRSGKAYGLVLQQSFGLEELAQLLCRAQPWPLAGQAEQEMPVQLAGCA